MPTSHTKLCRYDLHPLSERQDYRLTTATQGDVCGGAESYAGYAHFPPNCMEGIEHSYPIHTFFWYFKARRNPETAPLVIRISGGPGASSMWSLFLENGPCQVNANLTTSNNQWSWNNEFNILYIDQPVQAGFSYDDETNGTLDLTNGTITVSNSESTAATIPGVFASQNASRTANTTANAARQFWNIVQLWLRDFDIHKTTDNSVSLWTESYGGRFGPRFSAYIQDQNQHIEQGFLPGALMINLTTLGIINGCVDPLEQIRSGPEFAYDRNAYGIQGLTRQNYSDALVAYSQSGGCKDRITACLDLADSHDPEMYGNDDETNRVCQDASDFCQHEVEFPYTRRNQWGFYDITHCYLAPFPASYFIEYLAKEEVRDALGVPVNFTDMSAAVVSAFNTTGDYSRRGVQGYLPDIAGLLDAGITVALLYGDRDFACNWIGGERASLAVDYAKSHEFRKAGYADISIGAGIEPKGQVRQHGLFSFSRVYQAGHMISLAQPEALYYIFDRVMRGRDIATGTAAVNPDYSTNGTLGSTTLLVPGPAASPICYLRNMQSTCAPNQIDSLKNGTATIENGVIIDPKFPEGICPALPVPSPRRSKAKGWT